MTYFLNIDLVLYFILLLFSSVFSHNLKAYTVDDLLDLVKKYPSTQKLFQDYQKRPPIPIIFGKKNHYLYQKHIEIIKDASIYTSLLYLTHELVHFVYKTHPREKRVIHPIDFILSHMEQKGSEIHAFIQVCDLMVEMKLKKTNYEYCLEEEKIPDVFYQLGDFYDEFVHTFPPAVLHSFFPKVSNKPVVFRTDWNNLPYPIFYLRQITSCQANGKSATIKNKGENCYDF